MHSFPPPVTRPATAVVTGASSPLGRSFSVLLAHEGYDLVLVDERSEVWAVADDVHEMRDDASERSTTAVHLDLAASGSVEQLQEVLAHRDAPVAVGVLNAGVERARAVAARIDQAPVEHQLHEIDLVVRATVHLGALIAREMVARGAGRLVFVSSPDGRDPEPGRAAWSASQAFVHAYAEAAREELAPAGVTVSSVVPLRASGVRVARGEEA